MFQRRVAPTHRVYLQAFGWDVTEITQCYAAIPRETRGASPATGQSGEVKPGSTAANQLRRRPLLPSHWTEWPHGICHSFSHTKLFLSVNKTLLVYHSRASVLTNVCPMHKPARCRFWRHNQNIMALKSIKVKRQGQRSRSNVVEI